MRKWLIFPCAVFLFSGLVPIIPAQELDIPRFFGKNERFERPTLGRLPQLRFLTTVDFAPFSYLDSSGHLAGYHIDLARALCLELKLIDKCQIEAVPWEELEQKLKNGEGEVIIAGLAATSKTRIELAFSQPYMNFPARFVTSQKNNGENVEEVGLVKNSAHEKMFAAYFPESKVRLFDDYETLTHALRERIITRAFGDGLHFSLWLASASSQECCHFVDGLYHSPDYLGQGLRLAVLAQEKNLVQAFNYALASLEQQGKLTELYLRYFPVGFY